MNNTINLSQTILNNVTLPNQFTDFELISMYCNNFQIIFDNKIFFVFLLFNLLILLRIIIFLNQRYFKISFIQNIKRYVKLLEDYLYLGMGMFFTIYFILYAMRNGLININITKPIIFISIILFIISVSGYYTDNKEKIDKYIEKLKKGE